MKRKDKIAVSVIAVFAVGVLVYLVAPGVLGKQRQTTNDAFVAADFTLVAPRVAGFIKEVLVEDNQRVKAGQLLALIDSSIPGHAHPRQVLDEQADALEPATFDDVASKAAIA